MNKKRIALSAVEGTAIDMESYQERKHIKKQKMDVDIVGFDVDSGEKTQSTSAAFVHKQGFYEKYIKRLLDIICSGAALIVLSPVMLVTAVAVRISLGAPVLFVQERLGKDEVPFNLLKFRSMKNAFDDYGVPLPDQQRITKTGRMIRKLSLDELPSLLNIFRGDMSLVPTNYGPWFYNNERKRHSVKGGLTGLAQIHGRNTISWEERFAYDIQYVDHVTFFNDIKIILKTVELVLKRSGIGERGINSPGDFHVYRSGMTEQELVMWEKTQKERSCNA